MVFMLLVDSTDPCLPPQYFSRATSLTLLRLSYLPDSVRFILELILVIMTPSPGQTAYRSGFSLPPTQVVNGIIPRSPLIYRQKRICVFWCICKHILSLRSVADAHVSNRHALSTNFFLFLFPLHRIFVIYSICILNHGSCDETRLPLHQGTSTPSSSASAHPPLGLEDSLHGTSSISDDSHHEHDVGVMRPLTSKSKKDVQLLISDVHSTTSSAPELRSPVEYDFFQCMVSNFNATTTSTQIIRSSSFFISDFLSLFRGIS